jgi:replicative DNA helicase
MSAPDPLYEREDAERRIEQDLLGSVLLDRDAIFLVRDELSAEDFCGFGHAAIWTAMLELTSRGTPIDLSTLIPATTAHGIDPGYLADLLTKPAYAVHVEHYAGLVRERSQLRALMRTGQEIVRLAWTQSRAETAVARAQDLLAGLAARAPKDGGLTYAEAVPAFAEELQERWANPGRADVIPTGLRDLDRSLRGGGFERGQCVVVAARPGMAKSALMLQLAHNVARREVAVFREPRWTVIFSSEMTLRQLLIRAAAEASGLSGDAILSGHGLSREQRELLLGRLTLMARLPIWVDDASSPSVAQMRAAIERMRRERDVRCVMFDYLERAGDGDRRSASEELRVGAAIAGFKSIAKDCQTTSVVLCQINRAVEERPDKHPSMHDLRYSGRIEAEADIVLGLYRQDYYESLNRIAPADIDPTRRGTCEIDLLKQRDGVMRRHVVGFSPDTSSFHNLEA